jgi:hypothetical protein
MTFFHITSINIGVFSLGFTALLEQRGMMKSEILVSSPYKGLEHHLDLTSVPETSRQLALALQNLRAVTNDYQTEPYPESFNWGEIVDSLPSDFSGITPYISSFNIKGNSIASRSIQH